MVFSLFHVYFHVIFLVFNVDLFPFDVSAHLSHPLLHCFLHSLLPSFFSFPPSLSCFSHGKVSSTTLTFACQIYFLFYYYHLSFLFFFFLHLASLPVIFISLLREDLNSLLLLFWFAFSQVQSLFFIYLFIYLLFCILGKSIFSHSCTYFAIKKSKLLKMLPSLRFQSFFLFLSIYSLYIITYLHLPVKFSSPSLFCYCRVSTIFFLWHKGIQPKPKHNLAKRKTTNDMPIPLKSYIQD